MATGPTVRRRRLGTELRKLRESNGFKLEEVAAQLGVAPKPRTTKADLRCHRELGVGLPLNDRALGSRRETLPRRAIEARDRLEARNEELRILYVLLTRAMDRLILVGSEKAFAEKAHAWRIAAETPSLSKSFLDVLASTLLAHPGGEALLRAGRAELSVGGARVFARSIPAGSVALESASRVERQAGAPPVDGALLDAAKRVLNWAYPHWQQVLFPLKLTVSGLTRELIGPAAIPALNKRPKFLSADGLTSTERGTLTHAALMHLDLSALNGLPADALSVEIHRQLNDMWENGQLFEPLDAPIIEGFLTSEIGQKLLKSERVEREWAFNLRMPLREALDLPGEDAVLVQGVIDCCFLDEGQWTLLDYKTDRGEDIAALVERYRPQLALYERALERITGIPVRQKLLCLLRQGLAVPVQ